MQFQRTFTSRKAERPGLGNLSLAAGELPDHRAKPVGPDPLRDGAGVAEDDVAFAVHQECLGQAVDTPIQAAATVGV